MKATWRRRQRRFIFSDFFRMFLIFVCRTTPCDGNDNQASQVSPFESCLLDCVNGGVCRFGQTDASSSSNSTSKAAATRKGHYCFCPTGFTGVFCDIQFVMCENEDSVCFNGSPCQRDVDDSGAEFYHCECETDPAVSNLASRYAGRFCQQHGITTYCETKSGTKVTAEDKSSFYCSNSGICQSDHNSCSCPPQWTGAHCEVPLNLKNLYETQGFMNDPEVIPESSSQQQPSPSAAASPGGSKVAYVSLSILIASIVGAALWMRRYGAELHYGRIQERQEAPQAPGEARRKWRPHPMEMEMKQLSARRLSTDPALSPNQVV
jgi:hypothetical protein